MMGIEISAGHVAKGLVSGGRCMRALLLGAVGSVAFGPATLAMAQVSQVVPDQDGGIEEIVVTAQHRVERLQDVPISIVALDSRRLADIGATSLADIESAAPNVSFGTAGSNRTISIRGVGDSSRNIGSDARVGIYIDGVYQGRSYASDPDLIGIERVEVLRGPQGTLFGRNTVSGAINITTRKPSYEPGAEVQGEVGNYDYWRVAGRVDVPIVADKVALAVSASHSEREGFIHNVTLGEDINNINVESVRANLRMDPSERLEILIGADYQKAKAQTQSEPVSGPGRPGQLEVAFDSRPFDSRRIAGVSGTVNYVLPGDFTLTSITAYRDSEYHSITDEDYLPIFAATSNLNEASKQFTQELRVASPSEGRADFVAGLYYIHQDITTETKAETGPFFPVVGAGRSAFTPGNVVVNGIAAFANANYRLTDMLELTAGLRVTREKKRIRYAILDTTGFFANIPDFRDQRSDSDVSPRVGVNVHVNDDVMLYATVARASKSGGWNADFVRTVEQIGFGSEKATNYEAGVKSMLFDRHVQANISAFLTRFDDFQVFRFVPTPSGTILALDNAGKVTSKGVEAELIVRPFEHLSLSGSAAYTNAYFNVFKDAAGPGIDYDGRRVPSVPEWKTYVSAEYTLPIGGNGDRITAFVDYSYSDGYFANPSNDPMYKVDSFGILGARLSFISAKGVDVSLWGRNLTNKIYTRSRSQSFLGMQREVLELPRTYGVRAIVRF